MCVYFPIQFQTNSISLSLNSFSNDKDYVYKNIEEIFISFPTRHGEKRLVNMYGVILQMDTGKNILKLIDETEKVLSVDFSYHSDPRDFSAFARVIPERLGQNSIPFLTGDIIRIHRLLITSDLKSRCISAKFIVVSVFFLFEKLLFSLL